MIIKNNKNKNNKSKNNAFSKIGDIKDNLNNRIHKHPKRFKYFCYGSLLFIIFMFAYDATHYDDSSQTDHTQTAKTTKTNKNHNGVQQKHTYLNKPLTFSNGLQVTANDINWYKSDGKNDGGSTNGKTFLTVKLTLKNTSKKNITINSTDFKFLSDANYQRNIDNSNSYNSFSYGANQMGPLSINTKGLLEDVDGNQLKPNQSITCYTAADSDRDINQSNKYIKLLYLPQLKGSVSLDEAKPLIMSKRTPYIMLWTNGQKAIHNINNKTVNNANQQANKQQQQNIEQSKQKAIDEINNKFKQVKFNGNSFPANASLAMDKNGIDVTLTESIDGSQTDMQDLLTKVSQNIIIASLKDNNVQDEISLINFHDSSNNLIGNANTTDGSFTLNHYGRKLYQ